VAGGARWYLIDIDGPMTLLDRELAMLWKLTH
jgi:hypothetical protein